MRGKTVFVAVGVLMLFVVTGVVGTATASSPSYGIVGRMIEESPRKNSDHEFTGEYHET